MHQRPVRDRFLNLILRLVAILSVDVARGCSVRSRVVLTFGFCSPGAVHVRLTYVYAMGCTRHYVCHGRSSRERGLSRYQGISTYRASIRGTLYPLQVYLSDSCVIRLASYSISSCSVLFAFVTIVQIGKTPSIYPDKQFRIAKDRGHAESRGSIHVRKPYRMTAA
ncbi:hypothetical protein L210DRAFT_2476838 [Boletus edulis BED1]|uniref:Secreted protein n=1 Tax=Boletus edulis BED1 TaxID=1328754 RepID=A0AAD4BPD9_BOLED|nr:hypothetical protein L210DRAFT_2476838 [Boletus edulis BED1]